jgi:putative redox protein
VKGRQQIANLSATRADTAPKVFTRIHVHFTVTGTALDPKRVEQAVHLSAEKYCSASIMLGKTAEIMHNFEVVEG